MIATRRAAAVFVAALACLAAARAEAPTSRVRVPLSPELRERCLATLRGR